LAKARDIPQTGGITAFERSGGRSVEVVLRRRSGSQAGFELSTTGAAPDGPAVGVAPWARSLVRCRGMDDLPPDALLAAVGVMGDGELPERVPSWRKACGALQLAGDGRTALLTAWMPGEDDDALAIDRPRATYCAAAAALAYAASLGHGCIFAGDAEDGVLIVASHGPRGLVVRALRESVEVVSGDEHVLLRLTETAASVGLSEDHAREAVAASASPWDGRRVGWSEEISAGLERAFAGWPAEAREAAGILIPACAGAMALSSDAPTSALASMTLEKPAERPSARERMDAWLSSKRNVAIACVACVAILLFGPLLAAMLREALLSGKLETAETLRARYEADARTAAIYRQLNERVWPMTKTLAEVSAAAPVHVVLESVRLDASAQIDIEGFVQVAPGGPTLDGPPEQLLTQYESALNSLGTLGPVTVVRREVAGDSVEFQITAQVRRPTAPGDLPMDFAEMPLAEVLYGEGATNDAAPVLASASPGASRRPAGGTSSGGSRDRGDRDEAIASGRDASSDRRPTGAPASEDGVPTPVSDAQIAAMDRSTAMTEWRNRLTASRKPELDEETKARLAEEARKLNEHFRSLGSGG
jgi:hypothetical protein